MFGNQRPAAPWSYNNWWGQYATPGDLPNVLGSSLQINDVQAGDEAWVIDALSLYVCQVPTRNAASWVPVGSSVATALTNLYVAPSDPAASDANAGTSPTAPLATLDRALELLNTQGRFAVPCTVHLASDTYAWSRTLRNLVLDDTLTIIGDGADQPGDDGFTELQAASAAAAGTSQTAVVNAAVLVDNVYQGKTIEILTGAAAGDRRTIRNNTTTTFVPCQRFTAAVAPGDSFRIVEPGAVITMPSDGGQLFQTPYAIEGVGSPSTLDNGGADSGRRPNHESLLLANLRMLVPTGVAQQIQIGNSQVYFAGCEVTSPVSTSLVADRQSDLCSGVDAPLGTLSQFVLPFALGLAIARTSWVGWGLSVLRVGGGIVVFRPQSFCGFLVWQITAIGIAIASVVWYVLGGELNNDGVTNFNGAFRVSDGAIIVFSGSEAATAVRIINTSGDNRSAALRVIGGARVSLDTAEVRSAGLGCAIAVHGSESTTDRSLEAGVLSLVTSVILEGVRACVIVMTGGRAYWDSNPTVVGVPTVGEAVITQSATNGAAVPPSPTTFAAVADGVVVVNPDGSGTVLGKIT